MGVIEHLLEKQDGEFVSLRSLIEQISEEYNVSLAQAATILGRLLHSAPPGTSPQWYEYDKIRGLSEAFNTRSVEQRLRYVVENNCFDVDPDDIPF